MSLTPLPGRRGLFAAFVTQTAPAAHASSADCRRRCPSNWAACRPTQPITNQSSIFDQVALSFSIPCISCVKHYNVTGASADNTRHLKSFNDKVVQKNTIKATFRTRNRWQRTWMKLHTVQRHRAAAASAGPLINQSASRWVLIPWRRPGNQPGHLREGQKPPEIQNLSKGPV